MGTLATISGIILGIFFIIFVAFFGRLPALRRTPIAWMHRVIWIHLPNGVLALDQRLTSGKFSSSLSRFGHFMMNDRHPTVLIFYFLLLSVSQFLALPTAWSLLTLAQKAILTTLIVLTYALLYLASFSDPGFVTEVNLPFNLALYPYDFTLFHPAQPCRTCTTLKPARSKHCAICKRCVARMDHHCIFINNCVGRGNHHWFLLLLLFTGVQTLYGGCLGVSLIVAKIRARNAAWALLPWNANQGGGMLLHDWLVMWSWGLQDGVGLGSVSMLSVLTSPLVWGLLVYNLWLVWAGTTTNESMKWSDMAYEMADGFVFRRRMPPGRTRDLRFEAAWTRWPAETAQVVIQTGDGMPPPAEREWPGGEGEWERVWKLRDVENLYDLGLWDNLVDVFVPGYLFKDRDLPGAEEPSRSRRRRNFRISKPGRD